MKQLNPIIGVLCYNRPVHTALTLFFIMKNKHPGTPVHIFYGIKKSAKPQSAALDWMLKALQDAGFITVHYIDEDAAQNTGSNVDNLFHTLQQYEGEHSCFLKIDDDVLIGADTDMLMARLLAGIEEDDGVILAGQVVRQGISGNNPFCWAKDVERHRLVQREKGLCVMETYSAISFNLINNLKKLGLSTTCDTSKGDYWPYAARCWQNDMKLCTVLTPSIQLQHIGLTTVILDEPLVRHWAPATSWNPPGRVIHVPGFDFGGWETAHATGRIKEFTRTVLWEHAKHLNTAKNKLLQIMIESTAMYNPESADDVDLPPDPFEAKLKAKVMGDKHVIKRKVKSIKTKAAGGRRMTIKK